MDIFRKNVYTQLVMLEDCLHHSCELNKFIKVMDRSYSDVVKLGPDRDQKTVDLIIAHSVIDEIIEKMTAIPLIIEYLKLENLRMMHRFILGLEADKNE